jgi:hypothetical protein
MVLIIDRIEDVVCQNWWAGFKNFTTKETDAARWCGTPGLIVVSSIWQIPRRQGACLILNEEPFGFATI